MNSGKNQYCRYCNVVIFEPSVRDFVFIQKPVCYKCLKLQIWDYNNVYGCETNLEKFV